MIVTLAALFGLVSKASIVDEGSNEWVRLWRAICIENSIPLAAAAQASRLMIVPPDKRPWRGWSLVIIAVVVALVAAAVLVVTARAALTPGDVTLVHEHEFSDDRVTPLTDLDEAQAAEDAAWTAAEDAAWWRRHTALMDALAALPDNGPGPLSDELVEAYIGAVIASADRLDEPPTTAPIMAGKQKRPPPPRK